MKDPVYAFPSENDSEKTYNWINKGMTLRDYFAAAAREVKPSFISGHVSYIGDPDTVRR